MPNDPPHGAGSLDDLKGLDILLVEDSWVVGDALKQHLELLGANVAGPAASIAEAESLLAQHSPDVALVDVEAANNPMDSSPGSMRKACPL